jgi:hypothetical protein
LAHIVAHWKALSEDYNKIVWPGFAKKKDKPLTLLKKHRLGPQNAPESLGPGKSQKFTIRLPRWRSMLIEWKRWVATNIHLEGIEEPIVLI